MTSRFYWNSFMFTLMRPRTVFFVPLYFILIRVFNLKRGNVLRDLLPAMVPSSCKMELVHSVGLPNTISAFFLNPAKTGVLQRSVPILATTVLG